jgi:2-keto-4-pentenoate hydratase/2-oxohepta-3-ene-1,7-dioic acid hydratase in catechol pathway
MHHPLLLWSRIAIVLALLAVALPTHASELDRCLAAQGLPRVARALGPDGAPAYALVAAEEGGEPRALSPLAPLDTPLAEVFDLAASRTGGAGEVWELARDQARSRLCPPVGVAQADLDADRAVIVAAGLNYAAHAEEAGGGEVFVFPKPSSPTSPYLGVAPPTGVTLLDWEVELGLVLLEDVRLDALPDGEGLLSRAAFFVANDISDREPIIREKALTGPGTGFVRAKGQPGFLPLGPWMVRGTELGAALFACGAEGMGLRLDVDEGAGPTRRQEATTERMILEPSELIARIASQVAESGPATTMPRMLNGEPRNDPLALAAAGGGHHWPAGTIVLTGTPDGVALQAPDALPVLLRGLLRLRGPLEQFRVEEVERAARGEPGGYLEAGDVVWATIDGLGTQRFPILPAGSPQPADPCGGR